MGGYIRLYCLYNDGPSNKYNHTSGQWHNTLDGLCVIASLWHHDGAIGHQWQKALGGLCAVLRNGPCAGVRAHQWRNPLLRVCARSLLGHKHVLCNVTE